MGRSPAKRKAASDQRDACRKETEELEAALSKAEEAVRRRGRIEVRASALEERQQMLRAQLSDRQQQLEAQQEKSAQAAAEQQELERQKHITTALLEGLEATVAEFDEELEAARERRNQQGSQVRKLLDDLQSRRASRQAAAQELAECGAGVAAPQQRKHRSNRAAGKRHSQPAPRHAPGTSRGDGAGRARAARRRHSSSQGPSSCTRSFASSVRSIRWPFKNMTHSKSAKNSWSLKSATSELPATSFAMSSAQPTPK